MLMVLTLLFLTVPSPLFSDKNCKIILFVVESIEKLLPQLPLWQKCCKTQHLVRYMSTFSAAIWEHAERKIFPLKTSQERSVLLDSELQDYSRLFEEVHHT